MWSSMMPNQDLNIGKLVAIDINKIRSKEITLITRSVKTRRSDFETLNLKNDHGFAATTMFSR